MPMATNYHIHSWWYAAPQDQQSKSTQMTDTLIAPHRSSPLPPKHSPNNLDPLQLWPFPKTLNNSKRNPPHPLGHLPRPNLLVALQHNNSILHNNILGQLNRHLSLPQLQSPLHIHDHRPGFTHRRAMAGYYCPAPPESLWHIRRYGVAAWSG